MVEATYLGAATRYTLACDGGLEVIALEGHAPGALGSAHPVGTSLHVGWHAADAVMLANGGETT